ncbi:MAG: alpha/beta hydrolase-fold protein [Solirubrobacterales bacterium]
MKRVAITAAAIAAAVAVLWSVLNLTLLAGPDTRGASVEKVTVDSKAVPGEHPVSVVVPDDANGDAGRPLLLFLHGRSGNSETFTDQEAFFDALEAQGDRAPIVAFPDGGESSYWHDRDSGNWDSYLTDEVIPQVAEKFGADPAKVAVGGISMGGFGALNLALHHPGKFCAAGGHSPAIFLSGGESAPGAFDDADDFARNDVLSAARNDPAAFSGIPIWLDAGTKDPFVPGVSEMDAALTSAGADLTTNGAWRGGHDEAYWNAHWADYMEFYAGELAGCQP